MMKVIMTKLMTTKIRMKSWTTKIVFPTPTLFLITKMNLKRTMTL